MRSRRVVATIVSGALVSVYAMDGPALSAPPAPPPPVCPVTSMSAANQFSLVATPGGSVYSWGHNEWGQLGDGTTTTRPTPLRVPGLSGITTVAGGEDHSLALGPGGTVWAWGIGGAVGDGTWNHRYYPVQLAGMTGFIVAIDVGLNHTLALKSDGTVWAWGLGAAGQLGVGAQVNKSVPVQVPGLSGITAIAAGWESSMAVGAGGVVYAWGDNTHGQIGDGTTTMRLSPVQVPRFSGVTSVESGLGHSMALKPDGTVYAWGRNDHGQLGDGTTKPRYSPVQVKPLSGIVTIDLGLGGHSMARGGNGTLYVWGENQYYGPIGDGTYVNRLSPVVLGVCWDRNDNFVFAQPITTTPSSVTQSTAQATTEPGEPAPCANAGASVWFSYLHPVSAPPRQMYADTFGSSYDTTMGVWTGSALGALDLVTCGNDARGTLQSEASWLASPGVAYRIQVAGVSAATGSLALRLREGTLLALGDSVVAGHGMGPTPTGYPGNSPLAYPGLLGQSLNLRVYNRAKTGGCAGASADPGGCSSGNILQNELPGVTELPTHVLIGVGADDIEFAVCLTGYMQNTPEQDECRGAKLDARLATLRTNLDEVLRRVKLLSTPAPEVVVVGYYNPFSPAPDDQGYFSTFEDLAKTCDMWFPATIAHSPLNVLAATNKESVGFLVEAQRQQNDGYSYAVEVLDKLNEVLQAAATAPGVGARFVLPDFTGHDMCTTIYGGTAADTWVYGPDWNDRYEAWFSPNFSYDSRPMPGDCEFLQFDEELAIHYDIEIGGVDNGNYDLWFRTNCMVHPTREGHAALANQVRQYLPVP